MRDNAVMVGAIAIIAMCVATAAHEAVGHGGVCLLLGGRIAQLTSVYFRCALESRFVAPAGPAGNLAAGLIAWAALKWIPATFPRARLLAWLVMAFSLFWALGYLVYSLATGNGDYAIAGRDFLGRPEMMWRAGGVLAGVVLYVLFSGTLAIAAARLFGERTVHNLRTAWLAATVAAVAAAALYAPRRGDAMVQAGLEIGAASIPLLIARRQGEGAGEIPAIAISFPWTVAALVTYAAFALTLGMGLPA